MRKNWISPVIDFRNAISYLASRFCDPLKRRSNFPIANLINDKGELWSRTVTPVANIFISRHRFAFSLCPFSFPSSSSSHFLFTFLNQNLQSRRLLFFASFFLIFFLILLLLTQRIVPRKKKKKKNSSLRRKFNVAPLPIYTINLSSNGIICGSNTK